MISIDFIEQLVVQFRRDSSLQRTKICIKKYTSFYFICNVQRDDVKINLRLASKYMVNCFGHRNIFLGPILLSFMINMQLLLIYFIYTSYTIVVLGVAEYCYLDKNMVLPTHSK